MLEASPSLPAPADTLYSGVYERHAEGNHDRLRLASSKDDEDSFCCRATLQTRNRKMSRTR